MSISRPKVQLMLLYGCTANAKDFEVEKKYVEIFSLGKSEKIFLLKKLSLIVQKPTEE